MSSLLWQKASPQLLRVLQRTFVVLELLPAISVPVVLDAARSPVNTVVGLQYSCSLVPYVGASGTDSRFIGFFQGSETSTLFTLQQGFALPGFSGKAWAANGLVTIFFLLCFAGFETGKARCCFAGVTGSVNVGDNP